MRKLLFILLLIPTTSALQISEIMYDIDGRDAGYEWIEIYNDGEEVDLCAYRLYEAETNHFIRGNNCLLKSGEYIILADKPENLNFNARILDSAFSLSNTGEEICIRTAEKENADCVVYSNEMGAAGDGTSLQLVNGEWCSGAPTPGTDNKCQNEAVSLPRFDAPKQTTAEPEQAKPESSALQELDNTPAVESNKSELQEVTAKPEANMSKPAEPTARVVFESKQHKSTNSSLLLLLAVSIILNIVLIISTIRSYERK